MRKPSPYPANSLQPSTLEACPECDLLLNPATLAPGDKAHCPRCGYLLQRPHKHNIERTLALSIAGLVLIIPVNMLPMLGVKILGNAQEGTLWSGVTALFKEEMWAVAILVMLSSILLPLVNLVLAFVVSLHLFKVMPSRHITAWMRWYQHLYEWAMIEVYALGIIVACVKLSDMADVKFGLGLFAYAGLLIINAMLANEFDGYTFWRRITHLSGNHDV